MSCQNNPRIYIIGCFVATGGFLCGYQTGIMPGVSVKANFTTWFHDEMGISETHITSAILSSLLIGCVFGALLAGQISDRISRKYSIILNSIVFIIGASIQAASISLSMLLIGRFLSGLAVGAFSVLVPLYLSEIAPENVRGRLVSFHQLGVTIGIDVSFWIGYGMEIILSDKCIAWRIPFALQIVPAIILLVGISFCPFSPRWLMIQDRESEALMVLEKIRFCSDSEISQEIEWMKVELALERARNTQSYSSLIRGSLRRRLILGLGIQICQQLTGINSVIYYTPKIYSYTNFSLEFQNVTNGISGSINVLITIPTILFIDKLGRRIVLISGAIVMALSMLTTGGVMCSSGSNHDNLMTCCANISFISDKDAYIVVSSLYLFVAAFAFSWGPAIWIYCTELFPLTMRAKGTSILLATNWATNCIFSFIVPSLLGWLHSGTYIVFGVSCIIIGLLTFIFYPETKGVPLERMDELFSRPIHAFRWLRTRPRFNHMNSDDLAPILNNHRD